MNLVVGSSSDQGRDTGSTTGIDSGVVFERMDEEDVDLGSPRFEKVVGIVQSVFSFSVKRYQAGAIADILDKKQDIFVIPGTGSGKSLVYQVLPFLVKQPIVVVICPTLSSMDDQVCYTRST